MKLLNILLRNIKEKTQLEIRTLEGQTLMRNQVNPSNPIIDVSSLEHGNYMLRLSNKEKTYTTRFRKN
jgi:hypothetical protein